MLHQSLLFLLALLGTLLVSATDPREGRAEDAKIDAKVSYSRDIAPILALNCNRCHGGDDRTWWPFSDAAGLNTRSYASLMSGTHLFPVIVPGLPDASLLVADVRSHKMPFASPPLTERQITTIEQWIREGAREDQLTIPTRTLVISNVRLEELSVVSCLPTTQSYLTLVISDPRNGQVLQTLIQSAKWNPGYGEEKPGRWVNWQVNPDRRTWPRVVNVELQISYAENNPTGTVFVIPYDGGAGNPRSFVSTFLPNPASPPRDTYGRIQFFLKEDADADVQIAPSVGNMIAVVASKVARNLGAGMNYETWDLRDQQGHIVPRGEYVVKIRLVRPGTQTRLQDIAILFSVTPFGDKPE
jgi:hypothetical protein